MTKSLPKTLGQLLPRTFSAYGESTLRRGKAVPSEVGERVSLIISTLDALFEKVQRRRADRVRAILRAAFEDLCAYELSLVAADEPDQELVDGTRMLAFYAAIPGLNHALHTSNLWEAHDWIVACLTGALDPPLAVEIDLERYLSACAYATVNPYLSGPLSEWESQTLYYDRIFGGLPGEHALTIFRCAHGRLTSLHPRAGLIEAGPSLASWGIQRGSSEEAQDVVRRLVRVLRSSDVSKDDKKRILIFLSTNASEMSGWPPEHWARTALAECADDLVGHERLQLVLATCPGVGAIQDRASHVIDEIVAHEHWLQRQERDDLYLLDLARARLFSILAPTVRALALGGLVGLAQTLMGAYYGVDRDHIRSRDIMLVMGATDVGAVFASEGRTVSTVDTAAEASASHLAVVSACNRFLRTAISVPEAPESRPPSIKRIDRAGTPDEEHEGEFLAELVRHYAPDHVREPVSETLREMSAMVVVPGQQHPIQPLLMLRLGTTLPLSVSLATPQRDRPLRRVGVWVGDSQTAELEFNSVQAMLGAVGVEVQDIRGDKTAFMRFYQCPDWDLVWVISHGEFPHWRPYDAYIPISNGERVSLQELRRLHRGGDARRLLFLNICDGGTAGTLGGISRVGLGPGLVSRSQAIVSHIWPVNPVDALVFGCLVADQLQAGDGWFQAFRRALERIMQPRADVVAYLQERCGADVATRLERSRERGLACWGSPVFYE